MTSRQSTPLTTAAPSSSRAPARIALIGVSGYARVYLELVREVHDRGLVQVVAAVIINPDEEASAASDLQRRGATLYRDWEEMLRVHGGQLDLVLIPTGIAWHARMTIASLHAGAHVLVEKPLAGSMSEVAAIRAAQQATGRFVAVGFQDIYGAATGWLKRELCDGAIGALKSIRFLGIWPRGTGYFARNHWAGRLHADGVQVLDSPLSNAFGHFVNLCLFFAGSTPQASAHATQVESELFRAHAIESFDTAVVRACTEEGVSFWFGATHACHRTQEPEICIEGTGGRAVWRHEQSCRLDIAGRPPKEVALPSTSETRRAMFANVLQRLHDPAAIICDVSMAEQHMALIEKIHAASAIVPFGAPDVTWATLANLPGGTSPVPAVTGLDAALQRAFSAGQSLADAGFRVAAANAV